MNVGVSVSVAMGVNVTVGVSVFVGVKIEVAVSVAIGMSVLVGVSDGIVVFVGALVDVLVEVDELQILVACAVLRGPGEPVAKSELLLSVSVQPPEARALDVVFECADSAVPSKLLAPPYPTKSTILEFGKQSPLELPQDNVVVSFESATLPPETDMFVVPLASVAGSAKPHGLPEHPLVEPI